MSLPLCPVTEARSTEVINEVSKAPEEVVHQPLLSAPVQKVPGFSPVQCPGCEATKGLLPVSR